MDFEEHWSSVEAQVRRTCQRRLRDADAADEVLQRIRIRAWRGFDRFEGKSAFATWVITIAGREIVRFWDQATARANTGAVDDLDVFAAPEVEPESLPNMPEALAGSVDFAVEAGDLSAAEAVIVRAALADSESSWRLIAPRVGSTANHCAVLYHRALRKLRVTLLCHHQHLLGGSGPVQRAYRAALVATGDGRLIAEESEVFYRCVFEGAPPPARRREALREACRKVALQLNRD